MKFIFGTAVLLILASFTAVASGGDIYIDPSVDDPLEDGTQAHPYNTWTDITPGAGNTYYFKRGTVHRDGILIQNISGSQGNKLILKAYGSGDKPIITSRNRDTGSWTGPDGNGVYTRNIGVSYIEAFWVGDSSMTWGQEVKEIQSGTPADDQWEVAGTAIHYNPGPNSPTPGQNGFYSEWTESGGGWALSCLNIVNCSWVEVHDLVLARAAFHGAKIAGSTSIYFYDVNADYNGTSNKYHVGGGFISIGNGLEIGSGSHDIYFYDCTANYNFDNGLTVETAWPGPKPYNVYFVRCQGNYNGSSGGSVKGYTDGLSKGTFQYCEFAYNGNPNIVGANHYSRSGIKTYRGIPTLEYCLVHDNYGAGVQYVEDAGIGNLDSYVKYCIIYNNNTAGLSEKKHIGGIVIPNSYGVGSNSTVHIIGNTITGSGNHNQKYGIYQYNASKTANLVIKNNIIYNNKDYDLRIRSTPGTHLTLDIDGNSYSHSGPSGGITRIVDNVYTSGNLSNWNSLSYVGTDYTQDPLFANADGNDFRLASNSPCIDAGTDLGTNYAEALSPNTDWTTFPPSVLMANQGQHGSGWEIGAYVYTGDIGSPPVAPTGLRILTR